MLTFIRIKTLGLAGYLYALPVLEKKNEKSSGLQLGQSSSGTRWRMVMRKGGGLLTTGSSLTSWNIYSPRKLFTYLDRKWMVGRRLYTFWNGTFLGGHVIFGGYVYIYIYPGIPTTNKTMGVNITYHCLPKGFNRPNWANHYFNGGGSLGYIYIYYIHHTVYLLWMLNPTQDARRCFKSFFGRPRESHDWISGSGWAAS